MAKKNKKENKKNTREDSETSSKIRLLGELKRETKHSIFAIGAFVLGLIFILSYFDKAGIAGTLIDKIFGSLFGNGFFLLPLVLFFASFSLFYSIRPNIVSHTIIGTLIFLLSSLGAFSTIWGNYAGGYIGYFVSLPLLKFFDFSVSLIALIGIAVVSILIMLNMPLALKSWWKKDEDDSEEINVHINKMSSVDDDASIKEEVKEKTGDKAKKITAEKKNKDKNANEEDEFLEIKTDLKKSRLDFIPPPLSLLEGDRGKPSSGDIKANANIIKRTLQNFGIDVEMGEINIGPSVTQYTLKPAEGVKLSRIIGLQNDLSLALAAHPLRIEAPIPGRSLVGIEMPNNAKTTLGLASLFKEEGYAKSDLPLLVSLGRDVAGKALFANVAKMPHLLVAGATGSGKSIYIHSFITSLLYRNPPEALRFIMIDPKRVELTVYNDIPHMLTPTIIETKKAIITLKWLAKEMERRYEVLLSAGVRDILSYHKEKKESNPPMPFLIVIIDELADLMSPAASLCKSLPKLTREPSLIWPARKNFSATAICFTWRETPANPEESKGLTSRNKKSKRWSIISPTSTKTLTLKTWVRRWNKAGETPKGKALSPRRTSLK
ncbi:MAG: translocase FtsK protein [Candidatus Collierbacteria bacterium GW2011_GWA2_44_99]|uniref:Translocase FtsK protein n=1 Tax=Candidatus Collierbacteria bacterium GW2011_GWA2_44_99 TaxID=1618380 RepID=A0A0G1MVL8_9BACT|nr:MAG: translocase FtsK protein [Candidatus Collierbacteria bacterium GW2011_GWA2_44_99]